VKGDFVWKGFGVSFLAKGLEEVVGFFPNGLDSIAASKPKSRS